MTRSALVVLFVLTFCSATVHTARGEDDVTFSLMLLSCRATPCSAFLRAAHAVAQIAIDDVNNNVTTYGAPSLPSNVHLSLEVASVTVPPLPSPLPSYTQSAAMFGNSLAGRQDVVGTVLGTEVFAQEAVPLMVPIIQNGLSTVALSTAVEFRDQGLFPNTIRTAPSEMNAQYAVIALMQRYGWSQAAVVYSDNSCCSSMQSTYAANDNFGFTFDWYLVPAGATVLSSARAAFNQIAASDKRIIIMNIPSLSMVQIARAANESGVLRNPNFAIIGTDWAAQGSLALYYPEGLRAGLFDGMLVTDPYFIPQTPLGLELLYRFDDNTGTKRGVGKPFFAMYDAVLSYAHAIRMILAENANSVASITRAAITAVLSNVTFTGVRGPIRFEQNDLMMNGDLAFVTGGAYYRLGTFLQQPIDTSLPPAQRINYLTQLALVNNTVFASGSTQPPADRP